MLPTNLPSDYVFPDTAEWHVTDTSLAPRQTYSFHSPVAAREPDEEVDAIKYGSPRRLWVWGKVLYDDIFNDTHETKFCHNYIWVKMDNEKFNVMGFYHSRHNSTN